MNKKSDEFRIQEGLREVAGLCLLHDSLMKLVFNNNNEAAELLLNTVLAREDLQVINVSTQRTFISPSVNGRTIVIDIYAKDAEDKVYNVEVQRSDSGADVRRARFHSSMMDVNMLEAGQAFSELHDSYVIFITENDVMKRNLPLYHVNRVIEELGEGFYDGSHIIYVNAAYKDDKHPVGRLMHDFRCTNTKDMYNEVLAQQVRYFKESEGGKENMVCKFEELAKEWGADMAQDMAQDIEKERNLERARRALATGKYSPEEIAELFEITVEELLEEESLQSV